MGELLALAGLFLYSTNIVVTKVASGRMPLQLGFTLAVAVNVVCGGLVFLLQLALRSTSLGFDARAFGFFLLGGAFSTYLGRWFFFQAVDLLGPAKTSSFQVSNPMFTVVIAWVFLGEALAPLSLLAIAIAVTGLVMVSYVPGALVGARGYLRQRWERRPAGGAPPPAPLRRIFRRVSASGVAIALTSAASYSVSNVLRGAGVHRWNEPVLGATLGALVGMVLHLVTKGTLRTTWRDLRAARRDGVWLYGTIGVLTITAQTCSIGSMRYIPVSISNLITMATPVLVTPASYFLLKNQENLRPATVLGMALVLTGIGMLVIL